MIWRKTFSKGYQKGDWIPNPKSFVKECSISLPAAHSAKIFNYIAQKSYTFLEDGVYKAD